MEGRDTLIEELIREVQSLQKIVQEYDHIICWNTTCAESARLLDKSYEDYQTIQSLKEELLRAYGI